MKKILLIIVLFFMECHVDAMMEAIDEEDLTQARIADLELGGYESTQEGDEGLTPDELTTQIYQEKEIEDKYDRSHLHLMVQELYERDRLRYNELVSEVMPTRGHRHRERKEIDKLYTGLLKIRQSLHTTNQLLQQQIDGDNEQARIDTMRWRCDYCRECCFGTLGLVVGILGTSLVTSFIT